MILFENENRFVVFCLWYVQIQNARRFDINQRMRKEVNCTGEKHL